jgi:hypothetical protein
MSTKEVLDYQIKLDRYSGLEYVTENGEICYDYLSREFVVFSETYTEEVGRTPYPLCASAMLVAYCDNYLEG